MTKLMEREAVESLLTWYQSNHRDLPWRHTRDPYRIWISEIMLQQTRVEAVKSYYAAFLEAFPTVEDLANADEERLLKLWEGLGYYSRARNLQRAARTVMEQYDGELPADEGELRGLCGIGDYTAGAIASIAFGIPAPAVDGNVLRVLSRLTGSRMDIALADTKRHYAKALREVIPADRAGDFTQAMIELGATVCVPNGEARCSVCPLSGVCAACRESLTDELPVRSAKKPRRIEERTVLLIRDDDRTVLRKRPPKGLLAGLYELPNLEGHLSEGDVPAAVRALGFEPVRVERIEDAKHIFTHVEWHMAAYSVKVASDFDEGSLAPELHLVRSETLRREYAVPSAFSAYAKYF